MPTYTYAQILNYVQAAIVDVLQNGQVVAWNGQTYTKADLKTLTDMEDYYQSKSLQENLKNSRKRYSGRIRYV